MLNVDGTKPERLEIQIVKSRCWIAEYIPHQAHIICPNLWSTAAVDIKENMPTWL